ncbi:MAG TPA: hypothetical protein VMR14_18070 [Streptosporangiaceae bacterium]|jgi:hypothetical protein|nr:hypothetical protein [Streptosporangiaceae bacterium]
MTVLLGANARVFDPMREAGINALTWRAYRDQYNLIPKGWPVQESAPDARPLLSIRPVPDDLLAGRLDDQLKTLIAMAPPGVRLSTWHEASNLAGYPGYLNAATMTAVHEHMQELCRGSNVGYGSIICAVPSQTKPWMGTGLDWYGLDVYDFGGGQFRNWWNGGISKAKLFARLDDMLDTCRELSGHDSPEIDICETNSPRPQYRAAWFALLAEWMSANGGRYMETFWNPSGPLSGPWLPDDERTIDALRSIAATLRSLSDFVAGTGVPGRHRGAGLADQGRGRAALVPAGVVAPDRGHRAGAWHPGHRALAQGYQADRRRAGSRRGGADRARRGRAGRAGGPQSRGRGWRPDPHRQRGDDDGLGARPGAARLAAPIP